MTDPVDEADVLEQRTGLRQDDDDVPEPPEEVGEADPTDVYEQLLAVPDDGEE